MGNILWWKKRPPSEELDELVMQIRELEAQLKHLLADRASILRWVNCFAVLFVAVLSALAWLQHGPVRKRLLSVIAVWLCAVCLLFLLHHLVASAFGWLINRKRNRINLFTERKLAIIESVKENEKYNVAMELIKKYGGENGGGTEKKNGTNGGGNSSPFMRNKNGTTARRMGAKEENNGAQEQQQLRQQYPSAPTTTPAKLLPKLYEMQDITGVGSFSQSAKRTPTGMAAVTGATPYHRNHHQRTPIRPFIEQSRTPVDRILDFVMGESINNRYALICSNCHTHNGMAVKEEFESLSFFCFKCNCFNPSKNELKLRSQQQHHQLLHQQPSNFNLFSSSSSLSLLRLPSSSSHHNAKDGSGSGGDTTPTEYAVSLFKNFVGGNENTDESTENECASTAERRPSTISLQSEDEQQQQQEDANNKPSCSFPSKTGDKEE